MQNQWKDLIPFYVAGTLSDEETQALEAYLEQCGAPCYDEIEEWRTIASATWQYVDANSSSLPPLSQQVLTFVAKEAELRASGKLITPNGFNAEAVDNPTGAPVYTRQQATASNKKIRRNSRLPVTVVAAFMTMLVFGGILLSQLSPSDLEPQTQVIELTESVNEEVETLESIDESEVMGDASDFGAQVAIVPDNPDSSGIIATPTSFAPRPTVTPFPTATQTLIPRGTLLPPPDNNSSIESSVLTGVPFGTCWVRNETPSDLTTYRNASFDAEPQGSMGARSEIRINVVFDGWYMLSYNNWVHGSMVTVYGDCSQVWTATPTAIGDEIATQVPDGIPDCIVRNDGAEPVTLYQWASYESAPQGRLSVGEEAQIYIGQDGWYEVFYARWVNGSEVTLEGSGCNQLWVPTSTIPPPVTPSPTPFVEQTTAFVKTEFTILRSHADVRGQFLEQVAQGTGLEVLAHNGVNGPQRWYLVRGLSPTEGWVPSLDVDVIPNDLDVPVVTSPALPTVTPIGHVPTPVTESWSHISTVIEHGCGGVVGEQHTLLTQIQRLGDAIQVTYTVTGTAFTLNEVGPNTYSGAYGSVVVDLSFTSPTTYVANETVSHESGCVVRMTWAGTKQ